MDTLEAFIHMSVWMEKSRSLVRNEEIVQRLCGQLILFFFLISVKMT